MDELSLGIMQHISAAIPEHSLIDEDYGLLETQEETTFPCVLVDNMSGNWSDLGYSGAQKGTVMLTVRLVIDCFDDTHIDSTQEAHRRSPADDPQFIQDPSNVVFL